MSRSEYLSPCVNRLQEHTPPGPAHASTPSIFPVRSIVRICVELYSSKMSNGRLNWPNDKRKAGSKLSRR